MSDGDVRGLDKESSIRYTGDKHQSAFERKVIFVKNFLSLCTVLALLTGLVPASASVYDLGLIGGADGPTSIVIASPEEPDNTEGGALYQQAGPWHTWTAEQTQAAGSWTEDQWWAYWSAYENDAWSLVDRYDTDLTAWMEVYYPDQWDDDAYLEEWKTELGMPYPDGINVSLNGVWMTFGDAAPLAVEGRTMVPFRAFFEAMGAQVTYEDGHITAALESGDVLELDVGSTVLTWNEGDQLHEVDMGLTPYARSGRVYIPVRFAAEAMGLEVAWDDDLEAASLTDWDAMAADIDQNFTHLNALLAASMASVDPEQVYQSSETFRLSGTLYGEKENDTASLTLTGEGLTRGDGQMVSGSVKLDLDAGDMADTVFSQLPEDAETVLKDLNGAGLEVLLNGEEGVCYLRGALMPLLTEGLMDADTWLVLDGFAPSEEMTKLPLTAGNLLVTLYRNTPLLSYGYLFEADAVNSTARILQLLLGDDCFTVKENGSTTTYQVKHTWATLGAQAQKLGLLDEMDLSDLVSMVGDLPELSFSLTATVKDGTITHAELDLRLAVAGVSPVECVLTMASDEGLSSSGTLSIVSRYLGRLDASWETSSVPTQQTVPTAPGEDEPVITMDDLWEMQW